MKYCRYYYDHHQQTGEQLIGTKGELPGGNGWSGDDGRGRSGQIQVGWQVGMGLAGSLTNAKDELATAGQLVS